MGQDRIQKRRTMQADFKPAVSLGIAAPDSGSHDTSSLKNAERIETAVPGRSFPLRPDKRSDRIFFLSMAVAVTLTVFLGFAPSYYFKSLTHATHYPTGVPISPALAPLIHVHALVFSAWVLFFIAQTTLVATARIQVHRRLGIVGAVLATVMAILGFL